MNRCFLCNKHIEKYKGCTEDNDKYLNVWNTQLQCFVEAHVNCLNLNHIQERLMKQNKPVTISEMKSTQLYVDQYGQLYRKITDDLEKMLDGKWVVLSVNAELLTNLVFTQKYRGR